MAIGPRITAPYTGTFDPTYRFVTSWILPPRILFGLRALLSLYAFVTLFAVFGWNGSHGMSEESRHSFSYFTHLTYWGLAFYLAFSAIHTGSYCITGTPFLARWPRVLQIAHGIFYSTVVVYPWIVTGKSNPSLATWLGIFTYLERQGVVWRGQCPKLKDETDRYSCVLGSSCTKPLSHGILSLVQHVSACSQLALCCGRNLGAAD